MKDGKFTGKKRSEAKKNKAKGDFDLNRDLKLTEVSGPREDYYDKPYLRIEMINLKQAQRDMILGLWDGKEVVTGKDMHLSLLIEDKEQLKEAFSIIELVTNARSR